MPQRRRGRDGDGDAVAPCPTAEAQVLGRSSDFAAGTAPFAGGGPLVTVTVPSEHTVRHSWSFATAKPKPNAVAKDDAQAWLRAQAHTRLNGATDS